MYAVLNKRRGQPNELIAHTQAAVEVMTSGLHTSWNAVNIMLDKKVYHGNQRTKERVRKYASILLRPRVLRCTLDGPDNMGCCAEQVDNHGKVVDTMIV